METNGHGFDAQPLFEPEDPFDKMDPKDGFHVVKIEAAGTLAIYCQTYGGGEQINIVDTLHPENASVMIASWENPSEADQGEATRLTRCLDAVARYLTTGGTWQQLEDGMRMMRRVALGNLVFTGYHLLDSYLTADGTYQHIFVKDDQSGEAVLWEEPFYTAAGGVCGGFLDRTTLEMLHEPSDDDDEPGEAEEVETDSAVETEAPEPDQPLLPDRREPTDS